MTRNEMRPGQIGSLTLPNIQLMPLKTKMQCEIHHIFLACSASLEARNEAPMMPSPAIPVTTLGTSI